MNGTSAERKRGKARRDARRQRVPRAGGPRQEGETRNPIEYFIKFRPPIGENNLDTYWELEKRFTARGHETAGIQL